MEAASATVKEQYLPTPQASDASEVVNKAGTKANVKQTAVSETSKSTKPGKKQQGSSCYHVFMTLRFLLFLIQYTFTDQLDYEFSVFFVNEYILVKTVCAVSRV